MTPEDILSHAPLALTPAQREAYFRDGFVAVPGAVPPDLLAAIRAKSDEFLDKSRSVSGPNEFFDLGANHSPEQPHVRRLRKPVDADPLFWDVAAGDVMTRIAADLVGPDVTFHSCKLNYKWPGTGELVKWHQDINAWPHTNYSPVTLGIHLDDVGEDEGPLACVPGSHDGPLYTQFGPDGRWTGHLSAADEAQAHLETAVNLTGPAGTVIAINCRTIHASFANKTARVRPLLLNVYSSADAFPWTVSPTPTSRSGEIVRGQRARFVHLDPRPCEVPPEWDKIGYTSIFAAQKTAAE
ncbi:MAG: phytanoyl-CoA dioxygenase family protein [Alphaproteobacteria bacterium]|nr:phytanoyl-CoA dioxygenase family protein [Alphaproteobacteria bacterium]MCB9931324.1 phytanoyl-CoA dioxygenase family protein [Alphaproteobacteria bacterium]